MVWASPSIGEAVASAAASPLAPAIEVRLAPSGPTRPVDLVEALVDEDGVPIVGDDGGPVFVVEPAAGRALPSGCQRKLALPEGSPRAECGWQNGCEGVQRDGGCLCDVVRGEQAAGRVPEFDVDADGYWVLKD